MTRTEYEVLKDQINKFNDKYYIDNNPNISDQDYDLLLNKLKEYETENNIIDEDSPTNKVGSDLTNLFKKTKHDKPMLSIDNTYTENELKVFYNRCKKNLNNNDDIVFIAEKKIDGISISIKYNKGRLEKAVTRGDGKVGEDVTHNILKIKDIPQKVDCILPFEVRGEIYMKKSELERLNKVKESNNEQLLMNTRNAASGCIKRKDSNSLNNIKLSSFFYFLIGEDVESNKHFNDLLKLKKLGFKVDESFKVCNNFDDILEAINEFNPHIKKYEYEVDGVVLKINDKEKQSKLGNTSKYPKWLIAYKYPAETAETVIENIELQVGKSGIITPVAILKPVLLCGTNIKKCTLHNFDMMKLMDIRIGDTVIIHKAGEIIPNVIKVLTDKRSINSKAFEIPETCPNCNSKIEKDKTTIYYKCINKNCSDQLKNKIKYWASRKAMNIDGLGDSIISQLIDNNIIKDVSDLYTITKEDLLSLERIGEKSANNILQSIDNSKSNNFVNVLIALNINNVGSGTCERIVKKFNNIDDIKKATKEQLIDIEDIGETTADSILTFLNDKTNINIINKLRKSGLNFKDTNEKLNIGNNKLSNCVFCVTGTLKKYSRDDIHKIIKNNGGSVTTSITSKLNYLICGENAGSKLEKAKEKNVTILTEDEFIKMI